MYSLDIQDICELIEAFQLNRTLPREHFRQKLSTVHKPILLAKWTAEATYHQRLLYIMVQGFHNLQWYDEDVWTLLLKDIATKKKLNNLEFFQTFNKTLTEMNTDPTNPYFQKLEP